MKSLSELYKQDFNLWCEETLQKIRDRLYAQIDRENLIEEVDGLAKRDKGGRKAIMIGCSVCRR